MPRLNPSAAVLLAGFSLLLPAAGFAQTMGPPAGSKPVATLPAAAEQKLDAHIKSLHDELKITPAEEPAWTQFAHVMRANAINMNIAFQSRASVATMTAPQNMQSYAQLAQVHAQDMQMLAASFQTLYSTFPPAQKQLADAVFQDKMTKDKMKS